MGNGWNNCNTPNCQEPKHADCINGIGSCSCSKNNQNGVLETNKNCNLCQGSGMKMQRRGCDHCARHCDARNRTLVDLKDVQNTIRIYNHTIKRQKEEIKKLKANQQKELVFTDQNRSKFLSKSTNKKQKIQQLTSLTNISSKQNDAQKLTNDILNKPINNNLNDRNTLLNILGNISKKNGKNYLFYDSTKMNMKNDKNAKKELKFTLNLTKFEDDQNVQDEVNMAMTLKECIEKKEDHSILNDFKKKLSVTHNVSIDKIKITDIFCGTINITYVIDIPSDKIEVYYNENIKGKEKKIESVIKQQFKQYKDCKMHALLFRDAFDINMFDRNGNKTFNNGDTYKVGPKGREQSYIQPTGWVRYGLKVLGGKYGSDNTWLHPFQDPKNWYRCYHGTGSSNNNSGNSVDVMSFIFAGGFKMAGATMYGPGVYCSPDPKWLESSYAGTHVLNGKKYKFMLQCAVSPNGVRIYQDPHCGKNWQGGKPYGPIWVANSTTDIRAYAILIKEC